METKKIYILLTRFADNGSKAIEALAGCYYPHTSIGLEENYTNLDLVLSMLRIPYKRDHFGFFCSQFVAEVLHHSGAVKLTMKSTQYFSEDLKRLPGMKRNYQGNLGTMIEHLKLTPSFA